MTAPGTRAADPAGGRRAATGSGGINPTLVLAVVVPLLTVGAAFGLRTPSVGSSIEAPTTTALTRADRGCPAARGEGSVLVANSDAEVAGRVELRDLGDRDAEPAELTLDAGAVTRSDATGSAVVIGHDATAPGLLATRVAEGGLAAVACPAPAPDDWFTGLGARAEHASVVELQNPDLGAAVVDIRLFTRQGAVQVELLGIRVPGRSTHLVDLAETVPRRGDVSVHLAVSRGRLSATVRDRSARIGSDIDTSEWLPGQAEPQTRQVLLGLPVGRGRRTLTVTNPGDDQARVTLKVVSRESVFAPSDLDEIRVEPGAVVNVYLDQLLAREVKRDAVGLEVSSTVPVTTSLASLVDGDLLLVSPSTGLTGDAVALLPPGEGSVVIADATTTGLATLASYAADESQLESRQVEVTPGRAFPVTLPADTALVRLTLERTTASAVALVTSKKGAVAMPFSAPVEVGLVPGVRPAGR